MHRTPLRTAREGLHQGHRALEHSMRLSTAEKTFEIETDVQARVTQLLNEKLEGPSAHLALK